MNRSSHIALIKYQLDSQGHYLEDTSEVIFCSSVSEELFKELTKIAPLASLTIHEEEGTSESSAAQCIQNDKIADVFAFVKNAFMGLLKNTQPSSLESDDELTEAIYQFRTITNLYKLFELKYQKYQSDSTVIVQFGWKLG